MEAFQRTHIERNLPGLISDTDCNILFISHLVSKGVLGKYDAETLKTIENRIDRAAKFYDLIIKKANSYDGVRKAFKLTRQTGVEAILNQIKSPPLAPCTFSSNAIHSSTALEPKIRYEIRSPVHLFTGREEEIARLHEHIASQANEKTSTTIITQTASITGLGGIGKTELCRKYIEIYSEFYDENVIWIQAERESDMTRDFRTLAKHHLKISLKDAEGFQKDTKTVVDEVYKFFQGKRVLFVFDNVVSSEDEHLEIFMPTRVKAKPTILITSRDREWNDMQNKILTIGELTETESVLCVKRGLEIVNTSQDNIIKKLVKRLQYFPLAIQQAVSFIKLRGNLRHFDIEEYLSLFETNTKGLLNANVNTLANNKYSKTTYTTWKLTTDLIAMKEEYGKRSIKYLNMMAYFEPDRIPIDLFTKCFEKEKVSPFEVESALQLLIKYGMINSQPSEETISIHRLVQDVTRIDLKSDRKEEQVLSDCLSVFVTEVKYAEVRHAQSALHFSSTFPSVVKEFSVVTSSVDEILLLTGDNEYPKFHKTWQRILTCLLPEENTAVVKMESLLLRHTQHYQKYVKGHFLVLERINSLRDFQKIDFLTMCRTLSSIAETLKGLHRFNSSLKLAKSVFFKQYFNLQRDEEILVDTAVLVFNNYLELGDFKGALDWCETLIDYCNPNVSLHMPHSCKELLDGLNESERVHRYIKEIGKRCTQLFELHSAWKNAGINFSYFLHSEGYFKESLETANSMYELFKGIYGEYGCHTVKLLVFTSQLKKDMEKYDEAVTIFNTHNVTETVLYIEQKRTQMPFPSPLAKALSTMGKLEEVLKTLNEMLESYIRMHGREHKYVLDTILDIANVHIWMGKLEEALKSLWIAHKIEGQLKNTDRGEYSRTSSMLLELAVLKCYAGKYEEAVSIFKKPEIFRQMQYYESKMEKEFLAEVFVKALMGTGASEEALLMLYKTLNSYTKKYGQKHKYVVDTLLEIANVHIHKRKLEDALKISLTAHKIVKLMNVNCVDHSKTPNIFLDIAILKFLTENHEETLKLVSQVIKYGESEMEVSTLDTINAHSNVAIDALEEAFENICQIIDSYINIRGSEHEFVVDNLYELNVVKLGVGKCEECLIALLEVLKNDNDITICQDHYNVIGIILSVLRDV